MRKRARPQEGPRLSRSPVSRGIMQILFQFTVQTLRCGACLPKACGEQVVKLGFESGHSMLGSLAFSHFMTDVLVPVNSEDARIDR